MKRSALLEANLNQKHIHSSHGDENVVTIDLKIIPPLVYPLVIKVTNDGI
jgi:hypothetical protein